MRVSRSLAIALLVPSVLAACGQSSSPNSCLMPEALEAKSQSKIQLDDPSELTTSGFAPQTYSAGTKMVAVVKDDCATHGPISSQIPERFEGVTKSGARSYNWVLSASLSSEELEQMANEDSCIEMISRAGTDELNQSQDEGDFENDPQALPTDPQIKREIHLNAIGASEAYDIFYDAKTGIKREVVIAIIDSGVLVSHEDLKQNLWINKGEIPNNGKDDDRNGYVDDVYGYNFASRRASPLPERTQANGAWQWAHGTRVAGLAAATANNGRGGAGVAGHARIMALNNLGRDQYMDQADTANSIRYAVDNGADVINLSLGGSAAGAALKSAIKYAISKNVVVLAAAGNESRQIGSGYSAAGLAPSTPGLISIGNFQSQNFLRSTSSNYSTTYVELGAPGTNTMRSLLYTTDAASNSSYTGFSGTSAAVPVASGGAALAVALVKSRGYAVKAPEIENLLLQSARKVSTLKNYFRDGNALNLLNLARLIDQKYPPRGSGLDVSDVDGDSSDRDQQSECPAI